ncbi:AP-1 complex subunit sigma-3 isoform X1 [Meles meles]|uniref:AP-1 complex subunit sigma-3 isoform X1 n=1 Tax=Meles meles TaxID=9662 RepID=UPI001E6A00BC|nr:AP-1 complex subunit sigma-3 isoform X1 [Meles meles]
MIHFILLFSRQGKLRLQKWYTTLPDKERKKITREIVQIILSRGQRTSSFVDWKELKLVYKRYASLYFCCAVENQDNELLTLEIVHRYVELLDKYFGNVCELDIIFNFEKAYFILDEFIMGGEIQETSKKSAVKAIEDSDMLQEVDFISQPLLNCGFSMVKRWPVECRLISQHPHAAVLAHKTSPPMTLHFQSFPVMAEGKYSRIQRRQSHEMEGT